MGKEDPSLGGFICIFSALIYMSRPAAADFLALDRGQPALEPARPRARRKKV